MRLNHKKLWELTLSQDRVRLAWLTSVCVLDGPEDGILFRSNCVLDCDTVTNIPSFQEYSLLWNKTGLISPLVLDWFSYIKETGSWNYIYFVVLTGREQLILWGVDEFTKSTPLYRYYREFIDLLEDCLNDHAS